MTPDDLKLIRTEAEGMMPRAMKDGSDFPPVGLAPGATADTEWEDVADVPSPDWPLREGIVHRIVELLDYHFKEVANTIPHTAGTSNPDVLRNRADRHQRYRFEAQGMVILCQGLGPDAYAQIKKAMEREKGIRLP
jgi:hypothetical protein